MNGSVEMNKEARAEFKEWMYSRGKLDGKATREEEIIQAIMQNGGMSREDACKLIGVPYNKNKTSVKYPSCMSL